MLFVIPDCMCTSVADVACVMGTGTGLGLYIARACARRAGGDVSVLSAPGCGATFTQRFPVRVAAAAAACWATADAAFQRQQRRRSSEQLASSSEEAPSSPSAKRARVDAPATSAAPADDAPPPPTPDAAPPLRCVLADDALLNLKLVQRLLAQHAGFAVRTAVNGREALDLLVTACAAGEPPHIAVLDMQMPQMTGPGAQTHAHSQHGIMRAR